MCRWFALCVVVRISSLFFFFFNDPAPTEIYTLSLHDALPISAVRPRNAVSGQDARASGTQAAPAGRLVCSRSEEHTSELQSRLHLVCRLLLEKKKKRTSIAADACHPTSPRSLHWAPPSVPC